MEMSHSDPFWIPLISNTSKRSAVASILTDTIALKDLTVALEKLNPVTLAGAI